MSFRSPLLRHTTNLFRCRNCMTSNMPLKAKITNPAFTRGYLSQETNIERIVAEQAGDNPDDVLFSTSFGLRTIELNRPKKLNSLDGSMARKIVSRLKEWEKADLAQTIVIKGAGRAFCAGGDVAALAKLNIEGPEGQKESNDYFALEYKLDHLIATYPKPYIAYMDGITMGGGVGLSAHAPFRIATENTVFAMPETTIGFFPEVGASFFLPRMDGEMGTYLALTSEQLKGVDVFYHGIATHYIHSTSLEAVSARLAELEFPDRADLKTRHQLIDRTLAEFNTGVPAPRPQITGQKRILIDEIFARRNVLEILAQLETLVTGRHDADIQQWADKTIKTIRERSPTGVSVALRQMGEGKNWNIAHAFRKEHSIASHFMKHPDFIEGVTAKLINRKKERPNWSPSQLEDVTSEQVDEFFGPPTTEAGGDLKLIESGDHARYQEYPHGYLGLPTEKEILTYYKGGFNEQLDHERMHDKMKHSTERTLQHFMQLSGGWKAGLKEKIQEVLERQQILIDQRGEKPHREDIEGPDPELVKAPRE